MRIVHITTIGNEVHGITDTNEIISMAQIKGSPMVGCFVKPDGDGWKVVGNNVDSDCVGGVCPIK